MTASGIAERAAAIEPGVLRAEVRRWSVVIGVQPRRVRIQRMTGKWASCSATGTVSFSRDLLTEDARFRDVVIVHELVHLAVPNHGRLFRGLMSGFVPGWERIERRRVGRRFGPPGRCRGD